MDFFKSVKDTYKKYRMELELKIDSPTLSSTDAEFLPREGIILLRNTFNCDDLCHETAHALEHIHGKIGTINSHVFGGISTGMGMTEQTLDKLALEEFKVVTKIDSEDKSFQIYANHPSEMFARFITQYIKDPIKIRRKYPNISNSIEKRFKELKRV